MLCDGLIFQLTEQLNQLMESIPRAEDRGSDTGDTYQPISEMETSPSEEASPLNHTGINLSNSELESSPRSYL